MDIKEQKKQLRARMRAVERGLAEDEKRRADTAITEKLLSLPEYSRAGTVFAFVGTAGEIDTTAFLQSVLDSGRRLCVPLCTGAGIMEPKLLVSLEQLSPGAYGIPEPPPELPTVGPEEIELAVVPCLSCSRDGRRLGRGGGFYDRFLEKYSGHSVMLCREALILEDIPTQPHDRCLPVVVTEKGIFR